MWGLTSPICVKKGCPLSLPSLHSLYIDEVEHNIHGGRKGINIFKKIHSLYSSLCWCHNLCLWISCRSTSSQWPRWFLRWKKASCKPSKDNFMIFHTSMTIHWQVVFTLHPFSRVSLSNGQPIYMHEWGLLYDLIWHGLTHAYGALAMLEQCHQATASY